MRQTGNNSLIWHYSFLHMVLRSVSCQKGDHKCDKYALELWILQGKNKNSQGKCIPSACESVCHEIFVSHCQTVRLSSKP